MLPLVYVSAAFGCSAAGCANSGDEVRPTFTILVTHADKPLLQGQGQNYRQY
jgi:hypothetical protein